MDTNNTHIDDFVKDAVKRASLDHPDDEFISTLMNKVSRLEIENKAIVATPIISKNGWFLIGLIIISIFSMLIMFSSPGLSFPDFNFSFNNIISLYSAINIPSVFIIGLSAFAIFFTIQIFLLSVMNSKSR